MTTRDAVWGAVIERIVEDGRFRVSDLPFDESKRHTVRRVLREMEDMEYLYRRDDSPQTWRAGENAKLHFDLSEEARVLADYEG